MLLERDDELSVLRAFSAAAAQGHPGLLLVEAPAGIGKTRLLGEARRAAILAGVQVCSARGGELERELAFGVVRQLVEATLSERLLEGAAGAAREVFEGPASGVAGEDASFSILHALYRLIANLTGDAPVLLIVDNSSGATSRRCAGCATWRGASTGLTSRCSAGSARSSGRSTPT